MCGEIYFVVYKLLAIIKTHNSYVGRLCWRHCLFGLAAACIIWIFVFVGIFILVDWRRLLLFIFISFQFVFYFCVHFYVCSAFCTLIVYHLIHYLLANCQIVSLCGLLSIFCVFFRKFILYIFAGIKTRKYTLVIRTYFKQKKKKNKQLLSIFHWNFSGVKAEFCHRSCILLYGFFSWFVQRKTKNTTWTWNHFSNSKKTKIFTTSENPTQHIVSTKFPCIFRPFGNNTYNFFSLMSSHKFSAKIGFIWVINMQLF